MKELQSGMEKLGDELVDYIKERTESGKDVSGKAFKPYTDQYKKQKQRLGLYVGHPNIKLSGETLRGIKSKVTATDNAIELKISIDDPTLQERAGWVSRIRQFFGFSQKDAKRIDKLLNKIFGRK